MGSAAAERIALLFETRADLSGAQAVRQETTALGTAAKEAATQMAAAAQQGAGAQESLAATSASAAEQQAHLQATIEQTREAWARSGGDFEQFKRNLAAIVSGEDALAAAAKRATDQLERQAAVPTAGDRQLGPALPGAAPYDPSKVGPQLGPALPGTTTAMAAAASAAAAAKEIEKIPHAARTASNSLGLLAQAAVMGQGGMNGIAVAAGNVAQGLAVMSTSARVAAAATGIGALIAVVTIAVEALDHLGQKALDAKYAFDEVAHAGRIAVTSQAEQELDRAMHKLDELREAAREAASRDLYGADKLSFTPAGQAKRAVDEQEKYVQALFSRIRDLRKEDYERSLRDISAEADAQTTATGRYAAQLRVIEAERRDAIAKRQMTEAGADREAFARRYALWKAGYDYQQQLGTEVANAEAAVTKDVFTQRRVAADAAYEDEKRHVKDLTLSESAEAAILEELALKHTAIIALVDKEQKLAREGLKATVLQESPSVFDQVQGRLLAIDLQRQAEIKATGDVVLATEAAEQRKRQLYRDTLHAAAENLQSIMTITVDSANARTKAIFNFVKNLRAIEMGYEAVKDTVSALREGAEAVAAAGRGDFAGAGLHALAAIKFAAAAAEAGNAAGGGSVGGSGGAAGSGATTTFQPRANQGGGGTTIVLQTVNPTSREVVGETLYQINRAGVLKRPIPIAPTTGLVGAAA